jgi:hypothetical protein
MRMLTGLRGPQNLPLPNGAETYTGDLTYYNPALGACGITSSDNDAVVAVSHYTFDAVQTGSDPNQNPLCNRKIRATRVNEKTGKSVSIDVTVIDRCECFPSIAERDELFTFTCFMSCTNHVKGTGCEPTDLDVSPAMFSQMADPDLGRVPVTWAWL